MSAYEIARLARLAARLEERDPLGADAVLYAMYVLRRMPALDRSWGFVQDEPEPLPLLAPRLETPTAASHPRSIS